MVGLGGWGSGRSGAVTRCVPVWTALVAVVGLAACVRPEPVMTLPRTAADVLSDRVVFEVECIDRMYLNVYVPGLQYAPGHHRFQSDHVGVELPYLRVRAGARRQLRRGSAMGRRCVHRAAGPGASALPSPLRRFGRERTMQEFLASNDVVQRPTTAAAPTPSATAEEPQPTPPLVEAV